MSNPLEEENKDERGPPSDQLPPFENGDGNNNFNIDFVDDEFNSNGDGESCRMGLIDNWLNKNNKDNEKDDNSFGMTVVNSINNDGTTEQQQQQQQEEEEQLLDFSSLQAVQETTLYKNIVEDCGFFIEQFNDAAGFVCVQEQRRFPNVLFYSQLWKTGPINMDGNWLLAADLLLSGMLEDSRPLVPCADSCYVRDVQRRTTDSTNTITTDCQQPTMATGYRHLDVTQITSIYYVYNKKKDDENENDNDNDDDKKIRIPRITEKQTDLCYGWLEADKAYQNLRMCASESHVSRTMIAQKQQQQQQKRSSNNNRDRNSDNMANYYNNNNKLLQTARNVSRAFGFQRQQQERCSLKAIQKTCPKFDMIGVEGGPEFGPESESWIQDGFNYGDEYYSGASTTSSFFFGMEGILLISLVGVVAFFC